MITVFGLGFVGLTTALGFAHFGYKVYGLDVDQERKSVIRKGQLPFLEKGLDKALTEHLGENFIVTDSVEEALKQSEAIFYCVGTPFGDNGEADLKYLFSAIDETLEALPSGSTRLLIIKSTVPPGTTTDHILPYLEANGCRVGKDILLVNNPEFLREGHCWEDFIHADRIVAGCGETEGAEKLRKLYEPFGLPFFTVSYNTGEFIKYLSNSTLATMISFANEMSNIADAVGGIDIKEAFKLFHMDKRWNNADMATYAYPGCGYGGYCLPKDTKALYALSKNRGLEAKILHNVIDTNERMPDIIADRIARQISADDKIGVLGLAFKPNSDDVRDSASAKVIRALLKRGYRRIAGYDPVATENFKTYYGFDIEYADDLQEMVNNSDCLIILTAWDEFRFVKETSAVKVIDFRYM